MNISHTRHQASQESTIFSRLVEHFPFIFNLVRRHQPQSQDTKESYLPDGLSLSDTINTLDYGEMPSMIPSDGSAEGYGIYSAELQRLLSNDGDEINDLRLYDIFSFSSLVINNS